MRQSTLFLRTERAIPADEVAVNAQLLGRGHFVEKLMAGVYTYLPLGFRVRRRVESVIRKAMDGLGAAEILMPALHPRSTWDATHRWESMAAIMYQFKDHSGRDVGLGPTHEEVVAPLAKRAILSYADLPRAVYQIQTKFRDEPRAKSGLIRGREFTMKDLYSFHTDTESLGQFYTTVVAAYSSIFRACGLTTYVTEASGGDFSKEYSHEFMVESSAGEDHVIGCRVCATAQNTEVAHAKSGDPCPCGAGTLESMTTIEVGNTFKLGTRFSEAVSLTYRDTSGANHPVVMGSYGIGVDRLVGTIVEVHHDAKGIVWPASVAPFDVHLVAVGEYAGDLKAYAEGVYTALTAHGIETLFDDRVGVTAGEKFTDADLIGIPWRMVVSDRVRGVEKVALKARSSDEEIVMPLAKAFESIKSIS